MPFPSPCSGAQCCIMVKYSGDVKEGEGSESEPEPTLCWPVACWAWNRLMAPCCFFTSCLDFARRFWNQFYCTVSATTHHHVPQRKTLTLTLSKETPKFSATCLLVLVLGLCCFWKCASRMSCCSLVSLGLMSQLMGCGMLALK